MPDSADENTRAQGRISPGDRAAFKRKASDIEQRIGAARGAPPEERGGRAGANSRAMSYGFRMVADMVAAVIVGGVIGYFADYWLGTKPWLLIIFLVLGFVAGVRNTMRSYQRMQADILAVTGGDIGHDVPDDNDD